MKNQPLKYKTQYTASVFKDAERDYAVSFVGKELYDSIGKGKPFGYELFMKKDIKSAVEWLKDYIRNSKTIGDKGLVDADYVLERIDEAFPDLNTPKDNKTS